MIDVDDMVSIEASSVDFSHVFGMIFVLLGLFGFLIVMIDQQVMQVNQTRFERGLSNAVRAYATTYSTTPEDLKYISEGYLVRDDMNIYSIDTNPINVNRNLATDYFFNIMEHSTEHRKSSLQASGIYIINVITQYSAEYQPKPVYIVSIYKNGNEAQLVDTRCNTLEDVQALVEDILSVKVDIATDYNSSLRKAQEYKREESTTGFTQDITYSTFTTSMAIATDVPIGNMFGKKLVDVKEIQTYSIVRGKSKYAN